MEYTIERCDPDRLEELFRLRARVWVAEGADPHAFPDGSWSDSEDVRRTHWVVLDEGRIVAGASIGFHTALSQVEEPEAYHVIPSPAPGIIAAPARVVVDREYRGKGLAQALLDLQDQAAREAGASLAVRQASPTMRRILERRGWCYHGPGPLDPRFPGVEFSVMSLVLRGPQ